MNNLKISKNIFSFRKPKNINEYLTFGEFDLRQPPHAYFIDGTHQSPIQKSLLCSTKFEPVSASTVSN